MEGDPSSPELAAASALLLLSEEDHQNQYQQQQQLVLSLAKSHLPKKFDQVEEKITDAGSNSKEAAEDEGEKMMQSDSTSCPSSIIISEGSSDAVQSHCLHVMAAAARCQLLKLKVVRRTRSKVHYITGSRRSSPKARKIIATTISKASAPKMMTSRSATTPSQGSCMSSGGSSEISSARSSQYDVKKRSVPANREEMKKRGERSSHIRRRAEAILKLLSGGCSSEVRIRQLLGDSPDTSKALRMLVKMDAVKRSGAGGRFHPYIYTIAEESSTMAS